MQYEAEPHFLIHFEGFYAYRCQDEGDLCWPLTLGHLFLARRIVQNAPYLRWFHKINLHVHTKDHITHYCIATPR